MSSVLAEDLLWCLLTPQGQSQDMTGKVALLPSTSQSSLSNILPFTQYKKQLRASLNKLQVYLKRSTSSVAVVNLGNL